MAHFDFDEWMQLYKINPTEFERKRKELLSAEISAAPVEHQQKLQEIQAECDALSSSLPPLEATIELTKLMTSKVLDLQSTLTELDVAHKNFTKLKS